MPSSLGIEELDDLWHAVDYEVTWLHSRWAIYRQLFGTDETRVKILNQAASTFAHMLQGVLLDDVQLGLAKLGDPATSRVKGEVLRNLTLATLCQKVIEGGALTDELPPLLALYADACVKARERRNKKIAHFDLHTMLESEAVLEGPSRAEIEVALEALRAVMNCISLHFTGNQTAYHLVILNHDGNSLISTLELGLRYKALQSAPGKSFLATPGSPA